MLLIWGPYFGVMKDKDQLDLCKMCICHLEHRLVNFVVKSKQITHQ